MKILRITRLGHRNITSHIALNVVTIAVVSVIFSILIFLNIFMSSIKSTLSSVIEEKVGSDITLVNDLCIDEYTECDSDKEIMKTVKENIKQYNGEVVGSIKTYRNSHGDVIAVSDEKVVGKYVEIKNDSLKSTPKVVVSINGADSILNPVQSDYTQGVSFIKGNMKNAKEEVLGNSFKYYKRYSSDKYEGAQELKYEVVGITPRSYLDIKTAPRSDQVDLFDNFIVPLNGSRYDFIIINNDDALTKKLLAQLGFEQPAGFSSVVRFAKLEDAMVYIQNEDCSYLIKNKKECNGKGVISEVFPGRANLEMNYNSEQNTYKVVGYVLLAAAFIIMFLTFIKVVRQDSKIIALYYSLGMKVREIKLVYAMYLFELCLYSVIISTTISLLITYIIWILKSESFFAIIEYNFGYDVDKVFKIDFNLNYFAIIVVMFLSIPISILVTRGVFTRKNIVRKMKEE